MDCCTDDVTEEVVFWGAGQVGKTEIAINACGNFIEHDPAPILMVQPTLQLGQTWSKDRLAPMLRDSECFKGLVSDAKSRDSSNSILDKSFPGGNIAIAGANSPSSLAGRPRRVVIFDEEDSYDTYIGTEGDPVKLGEKRTETFYNRKKIKLSTAKKPRGVSRIERDFERGDRRRFHVPCLHCDEFQVLAFAQIKWPEGQPDEAYYECMHCGCILKEQDKTEMLRRGEWRAEAEFKGIASFHLSALYSPWVSWPKLVEEFLDSKKSRETLITFVNLFLAETWEDQISKIDEHTLLKRKEAYTVADENVLVITAGVDVQDNRFEVEVIGWGEGEESWSLDYFVIFGDTATPAAWEELDKVLQQSYPHQSGYDMNISGVCIDTAGHRTQMAYEFCSKRVLRRVFAIKGSNQSGRALITKPSTNNRLQVPLWMIGVDAAKEAVMSRLTIHQPGPGYCHFPMKYDEDHFKGLTAEVRVISYNRGVAILKWEKKKGQNRNEQLDCRVYGYAALKILNVNFERLKNEAKRKVNNEAGKPKPKAAPTKPDWIGSKKGWLDR